MKHLLLITALAVVLTSCKKEDGEGNKSKIPSTPPVEGDLVLTAKVEEIPGEFPPNELYNYAYIMKYEVDKVVKGDFAKDSILIGHYNPRFAREDITDDQASNVGGSLKTFEVGDTHYLVLKKMEDVWTGAIEDEYYKDDSPRYWALWTDKL